jgi:hypothetical protein
MVKIELKEYDEEDIKYYRRFGITNTFGEVDHYYTVYYYWYNGKREMHNSESFRTIEDAQKFYEKKIKDLEKKIA